jgi:hypothetical protein
VRTLLKAALANDIGGTRRTGYERARTVARKRLHASSNYDTPYGTLVQKLDIPLTNGQVEKIDYIHPLAFLYYAGTLSVAFGCFLKSCLKDLNRMVLYSDEVSPSDGLRFDQHRMYVAVYWTLLEFPPWFVSRNRLGWLPFAFIPTSVLRDGLTTFSNVLRVILRSLFSPDNWNFEVTGVRVPCGDGFVHIKAAFDSFLADEKAIKQAFGLKGASGTKPCACCKNVLGRCSFFSGHSSLVHVASAEVDKFVFHTNDSYREMVDNLKQGVADGVSISNLEQEYGLSYDATGVLFDDWTFRLVAMPDCIYWDHMHMVYASGGVAQYEVNQLVRNIRDKGVAFHEIDTWVQALQFPKEGVTKLPKRFFADRVVDADGKHIRAYAGEMLTAICVLGFFCDEFLAPEGILTDHLACLGHLRTMTDIFTSHRHDLVDTLEQATVSHHVAFFHLYEDCVKLKPHYLLHIARCIRRSRKILSCFPTERQHKNTKAIAGHCYGSLSYSVTAFELNRLLDNVADETSYAMVHLNGVVHPLAIDLRPFLPAAWGDVIAIDAGKQIATGKGNFCRGDVVGWHEGAYIHIGKAELFLCIATPLGKHHMAFVHRYQHHDGFKWRLDGAVPILVSIPSLLTPFPSVVEGNMISAFLPRFVN